MTQEEARGKWCPFSRVADDHDEVSFNRWQREDPEDPLIVVSTCCIGAQCMAWRWWKHPAGNTGDGYCGLAGKPYQS